MKELIIAFGLLLFIEGILYALFPSKMKNMLKTIEKMEVSQLRTGGLVFALIGFSEYMYMLHLIYLYVGRMQEPWFHLISRFIE